MGGALSPLGRLIFLLKVVESEFSTKGDGSEVAKLKGNLSEKLVICFTT
jgi:hypothetical protein